MRPSHNTFKRQDWKRGYEAEKTLTKETKGNQKTKAKPYSIAENANQNKFASKGLERASCLGEPGSFFKNKLLNVLRNHLNENLHN